MTHPFAEGDFNVFKAIFGLGRRALRMVTIPVLAATLAVAGCSQQATVSTTVKKVKDTSSGFPVTVKDDAGRVVKVKEVPKRLVSIAPTNTEMLFALGLGKQVVGVSSYDDYPPDVKAQEKVGDFVNPNMERIIALKPDMVFAAAGVQNPVLKRLEEAGIKVFVIDPRSIDQVLDVIERVGRVTGSEEKAVELTGGLKSRIDAVKGRAEKSKRKPRVFYEVYSQPLMTAGGPSVVNDMIATAGGVNVAGDVDKDFPQYSLETLIQKNPEIYIATTGSMQSPGDIAKRPGWEKIDAVKNGKVFVLDDNLVSRYGPRLIDGLEQMAKAIQGR